MAGLLVWVVMSAINYISLGMGVVLAVFGIEYLLYVYMPAKSVLAFIKYVNVWNAINTGTVMRDYLNWGYRTFIVDRTISTQNMLVIGIIVFGLTGIVLNAMTRPVRDGGLAAKLMSNISTKWNFVVSKMPVFVLELYKIMWMQKGYKEMLFLHL